VKRIARSHSAVKTVVLKVLGDDLFKAVMFGVSPKVRIKSTESVRSGRAKREAQDGLVRLEDGELAKKFLCFAASFGRLQKRAAGNQGARNDSHELDDRLMRNANGIGCDTLAEQICRNALLFRESYRYTSMFVSTSAVTVA
jgi:hypothetical protein